MNPALFFVVYLFTLFVHIVSAIIDSLFIFKSSPFFIQTQCKELWCGVEQDDCITLAMPWADGTTCGDSNDDLWCQHGQCVHRNRRALVKVDGGWGQWSR